MKNFISYSFVFLVSTMFFFSNTNEKKISIASIKQKTLQKGNLKDTSINKLPEGHKYISNFKLKKNKKTIAISQDSSGLMLFLNSKSVIFFDGKDETELYIENVPNTLIKDNNTDRFFVACKEGFGILKKNKKGTYIYNVISDINTIDNFTRLLKTENKVWFVSKHKIVSVNTDDIAKNRIEYFDRKKTITGSFVLKNKIYFSQYNKGLYLLENDTTIKNIISDSLFRNSEIIFSVKDNDNVILGLSNNEIYKFDGVNYSKIQTSSEKYIKESIISGGINFNEEELVLLTINGGAVIINKQTGKTINTINYRTGLPDDEIFCAKITPSGGLWVSHDYGISRVAFDIPVSNYEYPGLQGKINAIKVFDSTLYVATGEGLYKLAEIKSFEEVETAIKKKVKLWQKNNTKKASKIKNTKDENIINEEDVNSYNEYDNEGGIFSRWKKRRRKKKEKNQVQVNKQANKSDKPFNNDNKISYKIVYKDVVEYQKTYELQSVKYSFKKNKNIKSKCKQIIEFADGILIAGNSGLYFIKDNITKTIIPNEYVYNISGNNDIVFASTSSGIYKIELSNNKINQSKIIKETIKNIKLKNVFKENDTSIWCNAFNIIYNFGVKGDKITKIKKYIINNEQIEKLKIYKNKGRILFLTSNNVFYYNIEKDVILPQKNYDYIYRNSENIYDISDTSAILTSNKTITLKINTNAEIKNIKYAWLFKNIENIYVDKKGNIWILTSDNSICKIDNKTPQTNKKFRISIKSIYDGKGKNYENLNQIELESNYKSLIVNLSSAYYLKKNFIKYSYSVDRNNKERFIEHLGSQIEIPELKTGEHIIYFRATNDLNEKSEIISIVVSISPPLWQTRLFIILSFFVLLILLAIAISSFYKRKERRIKEYNQILEAKVKERTSEIQEQNRLIQNQNAEIYSQYQKINLQNEEITGSIRYAGRIQKAALPNTEVQKKYISGYFNLFRPRDIVSGDFYWMSEAQNKLFIAAVDCTGHGVPGGFLSMLGISFLNEIVREFNDDDNIKASHVLNKLRKKIIETLSQQGDEVTRDGMDMALAIIDKQNMILNFAGANNPAYIIRNSKLTKIDADRMPIGYNKKLNNISFTNKIIKLKEGDLIYLFSDGFADQFGGKFGKKFNSRRFRELLLHIEKFPMEKQKQVANAVLNKWKGDNNQIDDILLIGIKI